MKILVIMKRFGANKDMVIENFGRQIRLFEHLAKKHKIDFFCPDYTKKESKIISRNETRYIIKKVSLLSLLPFYNTLKNLIKNEKYDVIVATTDPLIGILGYSMSKNFRVPLIYDLQDIYAAYGAYKIPFVSYLDKKAVKNADVVLTVSESLRRYISKFRKKNTYVIQNGIDLGLFKEIDKKTARKKLNLPLKGKIIIYTGEISKDKGVDSLIEAFKEVKKIIPNIFLLLSGKVKGNINVNQNAVIYEKYSKREEVITALNAADIAIIPNTRSIFSKYCFPYKLFEYMAVGLPIVATNIGDVALFLKNFEGSLCKPNDVEDLKSKIIIQLKKDKVDYKKIVKNHSWLKLSKKIGNILEMLK